MSKISAPAPAPTRAFRIAQTVLALLLCAHAGLTLWCEFNAMCGPLSRWVAGYCLLALAGLLRRVVWGRFMVSVFMLLWVLEMVGRLLPDIGGRPGESWLERIFGAMPPLWLAWLIVIFASALALTPLVVIGWRRAYFRSDWW